MENPCTEIGEKIKGRKLRREGENQRGEIMKGNAHEVRFATKGVEKGEMLP